MTDLYPPESQNLDFIGHLEELRRRILFCLGFFLAAGLVSFAVGKTLIRLAQRPAEGLIQEFIFITPTEVFVSTIKISLLSGFVISFPFLLYQAWAFLSPAVSFSGRRNIIGWVVLGLVCFLGGIFFSYFIAIPAALRFLIHFAQGMATPQISLNKYVSFFGGLMIAGGLIFEIPAVLGFLTEAGIIKPSVLKTKREYAVIIILILAAVITPTQDIVNMLIFALPMLFLYEIGIAISSLIEKRKKKEEKER